MLLHLLISFPTNQLCSFYPLASFHTWLLLQLCLLIVPLICLSNIMFLPILHKYDVFSFSCSKKKSFSIQYFFTFSESSSTQFLFLQLVSFPNCLHLMYFCISMITKTFDKFNIIIQFFHRHLISSTHHLIFYKIKIVHHCWCYFYSLVHRSWVQFLHFVLGIEFVVTLFQHKPNRLSLLVGSSPLKPLTFNFVIWLLIFKSLLSNDSFQLPNFLWFYTITQKNWSCLH